MGHKKGCTCERCLLAEETSKRIYGRRPMPPGVRAEWEEKRSRQEYNEVLAGIMNIECPYCHHHSKVTIGPKIWCPKCGRVIE